MAGLLALLRGRDRVVRAIGGVVVFGMLAYLFTPLSAAGAEGAPEAFGINIRYVSGALLAGLALLPLPRFFDDRRRQWALLGVLLVVLVLTDRADAVLRDPERLFGLLLVVLAVLVPAALLLARGRGASRGIVAAGFAVLALVVVAIGYPLQRHYLDERFRNEVAAESIPGMHLDSAYRWAQGVEDARIGLAGTTAGFAQYGFYGTDLSNRVVYLGEEGPHGAFNAIPTCRAFRAAVNAADLDYLVTAPFLNFLHPGEPIASPEARWLRGEPAVGPVLRSGPVDGLEGPRRARPGQLRPRQRAAARTPRHLSRSNLGGDELSARERALPVGGGLPRAAGARATRAPAASPTGWSTRSAKSCGAGSASPSPPPSWPTSTGAAPTGACSWRSTSRRRLRATPSRSPTRPSGSTCAAPAISPAAAANRLSRRSRRVRVVGLGGGGAGAADDDLVGVDPDRDLAFAGPVLGVDGVVLDRGVEPEPVAVGFAVVEGRLELFAAAATTATAATAPAFRARPRRGPRSEPSPASSPSSSSSSSSTSSSSAAAASISASISSRRSTSLEPAFSSSAERSCCLRNSRSSVALISSWWAIQASVRPWCTQARIWLSCGFSERRAIGARVYSRVQVVRG